MPFCDTCDRFYNPNTLHHDGTCPTCGRQLGDPEAAALAADAPEASTRAPWHFKLLVAITVVYLSYRLVQGLVWLAHHL